jgi:hypothetical protein
MVDGVFGLDQDNEIIVKSTPDGVEVGFVGQPAVDLVNARQGPEAVAEAQRLTRRAAEFLTQLERQDRERLQEYVGTRERTEGFLSEWRAALGKRGPLKNSTVLGTVRLDRNAFVTTVRLAFDKGPIVVRFGWRLDKVAGNSDDLMLSSLAGPLRLSPVPFAAWSPYWYAANDTLFTFDLLTSTSLEATIIKRDGRVTELRFDTVPGNAGRWRRR